MENACNVSEDIKILPSYSPITHWHPGPERTGRRSALVRISLWPVIGLAVLISVVAVFALQMPASERIVRAADGRAWTASDAAAYIRGRLDDQAGRRYCEDLKDEAPAEASTKDQQFLAQLTRDICNQRLALPW